MGQFDRAEAALTEARPLLERAGPRALGYYLFNFAFLKSQAGDAVAARTHYEQSLALDRSTGFESRALATLGNLANVSWALGDLDSAEASLLQQLALVRDSPFRTGRQLGWTLASLAGVLTERGELDDALVAAREGLPLLLEAGSAWQHMDVLALRAALVGRLSDAAHLAGYADSAFADHGAARHPISHRNHRIPVQALLREKLPPEELERLLAEGAKMSEDDACEIALKE